jgi:hypothetical protein
MGSAGPGFERQLVAASLPISGRIILPESDLDDLERPRRRHELFLGVDQQDLP